jgi:hypothetical protein
MSDDLHSTADKFLREYLAQTGSKAELVQSAAPALSSVHQVAASKAAASEFIRQLNKSRKEEAKSERFEIEEPVRLVIARRTHCTKYFYGFKASKPIFTHCLSLAVIVDAVEATQVQTVLKTFEMETFVLPAPSGERGSL